MKPHQTTGLSRCLTLLILLLIGKIILSVLLNYRDYLPPNFEANFLRGRDAYFFGTYQWAFYPHIFSGPVALCLATILMSDQFRQKFPGWHRRLGKIQVATVLLIMAPSGFWMAWRAANGPIAAAGFACLAIATGMTISLGWRAAVLRRFDVHRRWMWRCFLCLFSAVVVRVNGGLGESLGITDNWFYAQTAWTSWLVPLAAFELVQLTRRRIKRQLVRAALPAVG